MNLPEGLISIVGLGLGIRVKSLVLFLVRIQYNNRPVICIKVRETTLESGSAGASSPSSNSGSTAR
jgi:hypothetical protein